MKDPDQVPISELMNPEPVCVSGDMTVGYVRDLLLERGISGAPVIDELGRPVGVISKTDLIGLGPDPLEHGHKKVRDVMTPVAFSLKASAPVAQAAALMAFEGVHRLPVLSGSGSVVGVLSSLDVLRWMAEQQGYFMSHRRGEPRGSAKG